MDIFEKEGLNKAEVMAWFSKKYGSMGFGQNEMLAAQTYLRDVKNKRVDMAQYMEHTFKPMNLVQFGENTNVRVIIGEEVRGTRRKYKGCPIDECFRKVKLSSDTGTYFCAEHGNVGNQFIDQMFVDFDATDGTMNPMRFAFTPRAIRNAVNAGLIRSVDDLVGRPTILAIKLDPIKKFIVNDILSFMGELDMSAQKRLEPRPVQQPIQQPVSMPQSMPKLTPSFAPKQTLEPSVPPKVSQGLRAALELYQERGGISVDDIIHWLSNLPEAQTIWAGKIDSTLAMRVIDSLGGITEVFVAEDGTQMVRLKVK